MTIRSEITGRYDSKSIEQLSFPVAWSGTVSDEDRKAQEADLGDLLQEAEECFRYAAFVNIRDGEIESTEDMEEEEIR